MELKRRSFAKSISWRCTATITTMMISWFITGSITFALKIGVVEFFAKMAIYYAHERFWQSVKYGVVPTDYQI